VGSLLWSGYDRPPTKSESEETNAHASDCRRDGDGSLGGLGDVPGRGGRAGRRRRLAAADQVAAARRECRLLVRSLSLRLPPLVGPALSLLGSAAPLAMALLALSREAKTMRAPAAAGVLSFCRNAWPRPSSLMLR
jgi:hypothetical protein